MKKHALSISSIILVLFTLAFSFCGCGGKTAKFDFSVSNGKIGVYNDWHYVTLDVTTVCVSGQYAVKQDPHNPEGGRAVLILADGTKIEGNCYKNAVNTDVDIREGDTIHAAWLFTVPKDLVPGEYTVKISWNDSEKTVEKVSFVLDGTTEEPNKAYLPTAESQYWFQIGDAEQTTMRGLRYMNIYNEDDGWLNGDGNGLSDELAHMKNPPKLSFSCGSDEQIRFINKSGNKAGRLELWSADGVHTLDYGENIEEYLNSHPGQYFLTMQIFEYGRTIDGRQESACLTEGIALEVRP